MGLRILAVWRCSKKQKWTTKKPNNKIVRNALEVQWVWRWAGNCCQDGGGVAAEGISPMPLSHAIMSSMQFYLDDVIAYAVMSAGWFCIFFYAIVSARTLLHNASVSAHRVPTLCWYRRRPYTLCTMHWVQEYCHIPGPQHKNVTVCLLVYCAQAMGTGTLPYPGSTARKCNGLSSHILCTSNGSRNIAISRVQPRPIHCTQSNGYS